jgi:hypothetical protein
MKYGIIPRTTNVDGVTLEINESGELQIKGGAVVTSMIEDYAVTKAKIGKVYNYSSVITDILYSDLSNVSKTNYSGIQVFKTLEIATTGVFSSTTIRCLFDVRCYGGGSTTYFLKVDGVTVATAVRNYNTSFLTISSDIVVNDNSIITVEASIPNPSDGTTHIRNFKILGTTELSGNNPFS